MDTRKIAIACQGARRMLAWVDARVTTALPGLAEWAQQLTDNVQEFSSLDKATMSLSQYGAICIEFDYPQPHHLKRVQSLSTCSRKPILLFTSWHSEELAIWAFRIGVADYVITPLTVADLAQVLSNFTIDHGQLKYQYNMTRFPPPPIVGEPRHDKSTAPARDYVTRHYGRAIQEADMAAICSLHPDKFSRRFHLEHGTTFRSFLLQTRLEQAKFALKCSSMTIAEIAYTVGFGDPSQFGRHFKNRYGITPKNLRLASRSMHSQKLTINPQHESRPPSGPSIMIAED